MHKIRNADNFETNNARGLKLEIWHVGLEINCAKCHQNRKWSKFVTGWFDMECHNKRTC